MPTVRGVEIERDSVVPVYEQIANVIAAQIESGELLPGARVPSESTLTQRFEVSRDTARRAVELLRQRGLVETRSGKGSYVIRKSKYQ
jgi:DNA-binding GntR family transcriptional regulator